MIHVGNCLDILPTLPADHFDSIVTDPPYGLGFMGKEWDHAVPWVPFWEAMLRVAKPGAHLVAFGGTRTFHRMMVAIEDAGWEIRDTLMWVYGSGFPKSHNGEWGGTALKPAWEPIVLARKPLKGTVAKNFAEHGTGGLNIDGCRVEHQTINGGNLADNPHLRGTKLRAAPVATAFGREGDETPLTSQLGRWPANVLHDGSDEVLARFPVTKSGALTAEQQARGGFAGAKSCYGTAATGGSGEYAASEGSAARFFYCAKASREDRNEGLEGMRVFRAGGRAEGSAGLATAYAGTRTEGQNIHPTVKPTDLMRWLCRLVTPPGGHVLDPFTGSGSTGRGATLEGFQFTGIELSEDYASIAEARIKVAQPGLALGVVA